MPVVTLDARPPAVGTSPVPTDLDIARLLAAARLAAHGLTLVAVTEADWPALAGLVDALGEEGRSRRFHGGATRLSETAARRLATAEPGRRAGYAAVTPDGRFAAHAMVCAVPGDGPEFAVMTAREWQGRGLATTLGSVLVAASRREGHRFWSAEILGTNQAAFTLVARLGRVERRRWDGSSVHVHIHLDG